MQKVRFSIIVPVYNLEQYIGDCVDSVFRQSFSDYELILVNDGSRDGSDGVIRRIMRENPQYTVRYFAQENQGLSAARNTGIRHAEGEYIVFLDGDDMLAEGALKGLDDAIRANDGPDFLVSRRLTLYGGDKTAVPCRYSFSDTMYALDRPDLFRTLYRMPDLWMGAWTFSLSREFLEKRGLTFYPGILHEDEERVPRMFFAPGSSCALNNAYLYVNRVEREGSITATPNIKRMTDKLFICDRLAGLFDGKNYGEAESQCVREHLARIVFGVLHDAHSYRRHPDYQKFLDNLRGHLYILMLNKERKYHIAYNLCRVAGISLVSSFLRYLS